MWMRLRVFEDSESKDSSDVEERMQTKAGLQGRVLLRGNVVEKVVTVEDCFFLEEGMLRSNRCFSVSGMVFI